MESDQLPTDRVAMLRMMPMPADANVHGDVFGGWIMSHVDVAGAISRRAPRGRARRLPSRHSCSGRYGFVGDLVSFYADIVKLGTTSITVDVGGIRRAQSARKGGRQGYRGDVGLCRHRRAAQAAAIAATLIRIYLVSAATVAAAVLPVI